MYLGVDLGGTNIAIGLVDNNFNIIDKKSIPTNAKRSDKEIIYDIAMLCINILSTNKLTENDIKWIGLGAPGNVNLKDGIIIFAPNIHFKNTPIKKYMQQYINVPIYVDNDANCAALGEAYVGATKNVNNSIMVTLGTGIGGGIIIDKKIYSGFNNAGAEIGHICIMLDGETCTCGRKGCWEAYASAVALIRQTSVAATKNSNSKLYNMINGNVQNITGKTAFDAMRNGCRVGEDVAKQYIKYLAVGIVDMINIFQPEILIIGGGVCNEGDYLLNPLMKIVEKERYSINVEQTQIKIAQLGNDAGIIGASVLGM